MTKLDFANDLNGYYCPLKIKVILSRSALIRVCSFLAVLFIAVSSQVQAESRCATADMHIAKIQGNFNSSPLTDPKLERYYSNENVTVTGVITAVVVPSAKSAKSGFYMQMARRTQGVNQQYAYASSGIWVDFQHTAKLTVGMQVCVTGIVFENYGMTSLIADKVELLGAAGEVTATDINTVARDRHLRDTLERYEGMLVNVTRFMALAVNKTLFFNKRYQRWQLMLSTKQLNLHPHSHYLPDSIPAMQLAKQNKNNRLYLESMHTEPALQQAELAKLASAHVGDSIVGVTGILDFSFGQFRLLLRGKITVETIIHEQQNTALKIKPPAHLRIASLNVNNYFVSQLNGVTNPTGKVRGIGSPEQQRIKEAILATAIEQLDADFIGLMEVENNGFATGSAIKRLRNLVNEKITDPNKHYQVVEPAPSELHQQTYLDTGAISVAGLYRPSQFYLKRAFTLTLPKQNLREDCFISQEAESRELNSLIPANQLLQIKTNKIQHRRTLMVLLKRKIKQKNRRNKAQNRPLLIAVNHFKSKGIACSLDRVDRVQINALSQGNCNNYRVMAAEHLKKQLVKLNHQYRSQGIILGDLNSYPQEQPIKTLLGSNGQQEYVNPFSMQDDKNWTYSFNDLGTLDYILLAKSLYPSLRQQQVWQIKQLAVAISKADNPMPLDTNCDQCAIIHNISLFLDHQPIFVDLK